MDIKNIKITATHTEQNSKLIVQLHIKGDQLNLGIAVKIRGNKQDPDITRMRAFCEKVKKEFLLTDQPNAKFSEEKTYWSVQLLDTIPEHFTPQEILEKIEQLQP